MYSTKGERGRRTGINRRIRSKACTGIFVFAMFLRIAIRRKYGIREECCTCTGVDGFEDACCACWCGCCATAQMARHEYLEVETGIVRYDCCSATGERTGE